MYTAGLDSGTYTVDVVVAASGPLRVVYEEAIPRARMVENPEAVVRLLERLHREYRLAALVISSGYGVPLKRAQEASEAEIRAATFIHEEDERRGLRILGLRRLMMLVKRSTLPAWFTPGVVQLPTVPQWRKLNRIDMGTSDKVYSVAAVLWWEREKLGTEPDELNLIVLEVGYAYTAAMAVERGAIVDGVGGTAAPLGYMGAGLWDSELAYLASWLEPRFSKNRLFEGGAASLAYQHPPPPPEEVEREARQGSRAAEAVIEALAEAAAKTVLQLLASQPRPRRIYLTGRWRRSSLFKGILMEKLEPIISRLDAGIAETGEPVKAKEAALGAAIIANGLAGGEYGWIVERLALRQSSGTVFDNVNIGGYGEKARRLLGLG